MLGSRVRIRSIAIALFTILSTSLLTNSIAYAQTTEAEVFNEDSSISEVDLDITESELSTLGFSPAGCVGKSNNPHKTLNSGGRVIIKGVTEINCNYSVSKLRTTAQLWRKRWWGYEKVGTKGDNTNFSARQVKASGIYLGCQNNTWRTEGEHWSWEGGKIYYAHTMRYANVTNC